MITDNLPESIHLTGVAIHRAVYIDGIWLNPEKSMEFYTFDDEGFNWGYIGNGPKQFTLGLLHHYDKQATQAAFDLLLKHFIARLPQFSFEGTFRFREFVDKGLKGDIDYSLVNIVETKTLEKFV